MNHNEKLKELQRSWYKKLEEEGFEDVEDTDSPREFLKSWHSMRFSKTFDEAKEDYYRMAEHFLNSHKFKNDRQKEIWRLHAEGKSIRTIMSELETNLTIKVKYWVIQETIVELAQIMRKK